MKKLLLLCICCVLAFGVSAQKNTVSRSAQKKTVSHSAGMNPVGRPAKKNNIIRLGQEDSRTSTEFKSLNDFFKWVDGKTFKGGWKDDPHTITFSGFWDYNKNMPASNGAKIMDGSMEIANPTDCWGISSGKAETMWMEYGQNAAVTVNKAKKILTIAPHNGVVGVLHMVETISLKGGFSSAEEVLAWVDNKAFVPDEGDLSICFVENKLVIGELFIKLKEQNVYVKEGLGIIETNMDGVRDEYIVDKNNNQIITKFKNEDGTVGTGVWKLNTEPVK